MLRTSLACICSYFIFIFVQNCCYQKANVLTTWGLFKDTTLEPKSSLDALESTTLQRTWTLTSNYKIYTFFKVWCLICSLSMIEVLIVTGSAKQRIPVTKLRQCRWKTGHGSKERRNCWKCGIRAPKKNVEAQQYRRWIQNQTHCEGKIK